jgi:hypothetical protein
MNAKKIITYAVSFATGASFLMGFAILPANAQTVSTVAPATVSTKAQANSAARLAKIINRSDTEITVRVSALNALATRIQAMVNVSSTEKTNIANEVQTNTASLNSLKTKINADTDVTTALNDEKAIFGPLRIYALVIPQGYIEASVDRVGTVTNLMTTLSAKLQTRITSDQAAGKDVTSLQTALTDLNTKVADAKTQAGVAQTGVVSLTPDQGNKTILASNTAALKAARANIKTATTDLQTARQDAKIIVQGLKTLGVNTSTTTPVSQ